MATNWDDLAELTEAKAMAENNNNLLLVDGVNLAFRYLQRKNYNNYTDDYIRTITSLGKSYGAKRIICCFDAGASAYRKAMYPEYKQNRKIERSEEEQERFTEFFNCLTDTIDALPFEHYKFKGIEADDVIAYFTKNLSPKYDHTWIISSDRDLFQLLKPNVSIFNMYSRKEIDIDYLDSEYGLTPREYSYARMIEGDAGDGITGVEGIGPKRSIALIKEYKTIQNLISSLPIAGKAKYIQNLNKSLDILQRNEKLINLLDYIDVVIGSVEKQELIEEMLTKALKV
jgi:5'-3' exonuclease